MLSPIIFNFDYSVRDLPEAEEISLSDWQERVRYGCSWANFNRLEQYLKTQIDLCAARLSFLGSGDYHHITHMLLRNLSRLESIHVVVFDNHPDNMLFPFGIHCGSWVHHAARLPFVSRITVVGICSDDVRGRSVFENHWGHLRSGKVEYLCFRPSSPILRKISAGGCIDVSSISDDADIERLIQLLQLQGEPIYLSIDKDVLAPSEISTNWDQGVMKREILLQIVDRLMPSVIGGDVTGEVSFYEYETQWKRMLSRLDGQKDLSKESVPEYQKQHAVLNREISSIFNGARAVPRSQARAQ